ncbi:MAG TPA: VWA domain-containing protein [Bryobacteraceae bacterium]|jgi:VWFA-related protein
MKKYKLLALALTFVAFQEVPAQVIFTSETRLIVVNVSVKDKMGKPVLDLKKEDFEITEDGKKQDPNVFQFEKLNNDLLTPVADEEGGPKQLEERVAAAPKPAAPKPAAAAAAQITSGGLANSQRKDKRLMAMFFDMTTMPQFDQIRAQENAIKFVKEQMTSSDLVQIMVYGNKLNVVEEFTDDREKLLADLKNLVIGQGSELAGGAATSGAEGDDSGGFTQDDTEFNIFNTDRQLAAIGDAVRMLAAFPEKKAMIYFSSGIPKNGIDNQAQLRAATAAAVRANVSIYAVDSRGLQASSPAGDATAQSSRGTGTFTGSSQASRISGQQDTQETIATLSADTGGKVMLDNNDLTMGFKAAQTDMSSYYILGYNSTNFANDGKYRHIKVRLVNPQLAANTKALEYKEGYYANKEFKKFTAADKEQQLQEALTLGDPLSDLPMVLEADYFRVAQNRYFVPISVKIPGSEIALAKKTSGLETTDFDFVGVVKAPDGKTLGQLPQWATTGVRDNIPIQLKGKDAAELEKRSLQYDTGLTLPPGTYVIRFLARENQTGHMGTFETPAFTIPDLNAEKTLRLSSIIYSSQKDPVAAAVGSAVNDKKALTNHPLIQDGQKLVPSITGVFRQDQNMYVYFEVYDPTPNEQKTPDVTAEVDLYRGARKVYSSAPLDVKKLSTARPGIAPFNFQIPLGKIPTGQYTAQVSVIDETGKKFAFPRRAIIVLPAQTATAAVAPAAAAPAQPNQ